MRFHHGAGRTGYPPILALTVAAAVCGLSGCTDDPPKRDASGPAIQIGEVQVPRAAFDRKLGRLQAQYPESEVRQIPDLPKELARGLIQTEWVRQEAIALGITVTRAPAEASARRDWIYTRVLRARSNTDVKPDAIARYYRTHRHEFRQPEERDFWLIITRTRTDADAARRLLRDGKPWRVAVDRYSLDRGLQQIDHGYRSVPRSKLPAGLARIVFSADVGPTSAPVYATGRWYVYKVVQKYHAGMAPLSKVAPQIQRDLAQARTGVELDRFLMQKYSGRTSCASDLRIPECGSRQAS